MPRDRLRSVAVYRPRAFEEHAFATVTTIGGHGENIHHIFLHG